jgi:hypothetical protein
MQTSTEATTVQDLMQDLYNFPNEAQLSFRDADGRVFSLAGFEVGSNGVVVILNDEE